MSERFRALLEAYKKHAPEIETGASAIGLIGMGGVAINPEAAREASEVSPIGIDAVASAGERLGIPDQAVFAVMTVFFGLATLHGVSRIRNRNNSGSK